MTAADDLDESRPELVGGEYTSNTYGVTVVVDHVYRGDKTVQLVIMGGQNGCDLDAGSARGLARHLDRVADHLEPL